MLYRGIFIDGNEPYRRNRLAEMVDDLPKHVRARIKSLYDDKGCLTVRWIDHLYEPNRAMLIEQAWQRRGEPMVAHVDERHDINHDTFPDNFFEQHR